MFYAMSTNFGDYLKGQIAARRKSEGRVWTQNELARRAGISGGHISMIVNGRVEADPPTLKKIAAALKVAPEEVYAAAGVLPPAEETLSGEVLALAREIDQLPEVARGHAVIAARATLGAMYAMIGESITEEYPVLSERDYLAAIIRQFRDTDPEEYGRFVAALQADDDKTRPAPRTAGGGGRARR